MFQHALINLWHATLIFVSVVAVCVWYELGKFPFNKRREIQESNDASPQSSVYALDPNELSFQSRPLLNVSERKLWGHLVEWRNIQAPFLNLSSQVCYGEFLSTPRSDHYRAINTKRADFVIWDDAARVRTVIEFDGKGHWGDSEQDAARAQHADLIKNRALASAGIPLLRIRSGYTVDELAANLAEALVCMQSPADMPPLKPAASSGAQSADSPFQRKRV